MTELHSSWQHASGIQGLDEPIARLNPFPRHKKLAKEKATICELTARKLPELDRLCYVQEPGNKRVTMDTAALACNFLGC